MIWDEVGETDEERDNMLFEIEQECLEVYRRRVDKANKNRAQLRQAIADSEAELAAICSSLGKPPVHIRQIDQHPVSLKAELRTLLPQLEEMQKRKSDRKRQFLEVLEKIHKIKYEIYGPNGYSNKKIALDEADLSLRKLEELQRKLQALQEAKKRAFEVSLESHQHLEHALFGSWSYTKTQRSNYKGCSSSKTLQHHYWRYGI